MLRLSTFFVVASCVIFSFAADTANAQLRSRNANNANQSKQPHGLSKPKTEIKVRLPKNVDKPVLTLDKVGGYRMKATEGFEPTPMLQIFADGRVLTGRKSKLVAEVEDRIDLVDLQKLLVFASDDCRFFDITSSMLKTDIESNRVGKVMDAPTTLLEINLENHSNRIEVYGLSFVAKDLSNVPSVSATVAIVARCRKLIGKTRLGSKEEADARLQSVNRSLAKEFPMAPKFTIEHLQSAEQFTDGRRMATFVHNFKLNEDNMVAYATLEISSDAKETVNLNVQQQPTSNSRRR